MRLIWKLLRKHISIFELSVFFVANLIGMVVILGGIQIYSDLKPLVAGDNALVGNDYVVISKPVKRLNSKTIFSNNEIEELKSQSFTLRLGKFTPAMYKVYGGIDIAGQRFSTYMFFEAIPNDFIDVKSKEWKFNKTKHRVPIIIPRNYLNLYNFGFSQTSDQLPQITESMMKDLELDLTLGAGDKSIKFKGRVVGFTDRLNTILVPQEFINWSNKKLAKGETAEISRLILEVENPSDPELLAYFDDHGYVPEGKPAESNKALFLLKVGTGVVIGIGLVFSVLSLIILTLSIYLLLQKNIDKLRTLIQIGYRPTTVATPYNVIAVIINASIMVISIWLLSHVRVLYIDYLAEAAGREIEGGMTLTIAAGVVLMIAMIMFNLYIIRRKVTQISRMK